MPDIPDKTRNLMIHMTSFYAWLITNGEITDIKVGFSSKLRRALGRCHASRREIVYSSHYLARNSHSMAALRQLVIHECIHMIHSGHGRKYKNTCKQFEINPIYIPEDAFLVVKQYFAVCDSCMTVNGSYHIKPSSWMLGKGCQECSGNLVMKDIHWFNWLKQKSW
jgi:predicted SprT family Zn-dependent metalloprotease